MLYVRLLSCICSFALLSSCPLTFLGKIGESVSKKCSLFLSSGFLSFFDSPACYVVIVESLLLRTMPIFSFSFLWFSSEKEGVHVNSLFSPLFPSFFSPPTTLRCFKNTLFSTCTYPFFRLYHFFFSLLSMTRFIFSYSPNP